MTGIVYLVRHGEVENPDHVVYADLPGFGLSAQGREEAALAAAWFRERPIAAVIASPLQRARETAQAIAAPHGLTVSVDEELTEWGLARRWAGVRWDDLPTRFPGEVEAYLADPEHLPFSPESLDALAARTAAAVRAAAAAHPGREVVCVSHQDPVQTARLRLTGRPLADLPADKPGHCGVIVLRPGDRWEEVGTWTPETATASQFPPPPTDTGRMS